MKIYAKNVLTFIKHKQKPVSIKLLAYQETKSSVNHVVLLNEIPRLRHSVLTAMFQILFVKLVPINILKWNWRNLTGYHQIFPSFIQGQLIKSIMCGVISLHFFNNKCERLREKKQLINKSIYHNEGGGKYTDIQNVITEVSNVFSIYLPVEIER